MPIYDAHDDAETVDDVVAELRRLRLRAGNPSYAEIVRRIAADRAAAGIPSAAVRPARTTIYDSFRLGRSRLSAELVVEIARGLGMDEHGAAELGQRSARALPGDPQQTRPAAPVKPCPNSTEAPAVPAESAPVESAEVYPVDDPSSVQGGSGARLGIGGSLLLLLGCITINVAGYVLVNILSLPLYRDMTGTAIAAIVLGPWFGAVVGVVTTMAGMTVHGTVALPFGLVNVAGALVWGYGFRRLRGAAGLRYFLLCGVVAVTCSLIAAPLLLSLFGGGTGHAGDLVTGRLQDLGAPAVAAVFGSNLLASLPDKFLDGFIAFGALLGLRRMLLLRGLPKSVSRPGLQVEGAGDDPARKGSGSSVR